MRWRDIRRNSKLLRIVHQDLIIKRWEEKDTDNENNGQGDYSRKKTDKFGRHTNMEKELESSLGESQEDELENIITDGSPMDTGKLTSISHGGGEHKIQEEFMDTLSKEPPTNTTQLTEEGQEDDTTLGDSQKSITVSQDNTINYLNKMKSTRDESQPKTVQSTESLGGESVNSRVT